MTETKRRSERLATYIASAPLTCAIVFLATLAFVGGLLGYLFADHDELARQIRDPRAAFEWFGAGLTAVGAILATFRMHARGRTAPWRAGPLLTFAAWQLATIYLCHDIPMEKPAEQIFYGRSPDCFLFILAISIPVSSALFWVLRQHRVPLGSSVAAMAGLSAAAASIWLMQFFHAFEMNIGDWSIHFAAIGIVVGSAAYARHILSSV